MNNCEYKDGDKCSNPGRHADLVDGEECCGEENCDYFEVEGSCAECKERFVCPNQFLYDGGCCAAFKKGDSKIKVADVNITGHRLKGDWILKKICKVLKEEDTLDSKCGNLFLIDTSWMVKKDLIKQLEEEFNK